MTDFKKLFSDADAARAAAKAEREETARVAANNQKAARDTAMKLVRERISPLIQDMQKALSDKSIELADNIESKDDHVEITLKMGSSGFLYGTGPFGSDSATIKVQANGLTIVTIAHGATRKSSIATIEKDMEEVATRLYESLNEAAQAPARRR